MEINKTVVVDSDGVSLIPCNKDKIILTNTNANLSDHFAKIKYRINGKYDKAPAFTIAADGTIYQHFDPEKYTNFMGDDSIDKPAIIVSLENVGFLRKDETDGSYYDWRGYQYKGRVLEKSWREKKYWAKYTNKQTTALIELIEYLCIEYDIEKNFIGNNVSAHKPELFHGILNRSNFYFFRHDLSPAMDFDNLSKQINKNNTDNNEK